MAIPSSILRRLTSRYKPVRVPGLPPLIGGAIGYFAYDMVRLVERIPASGRDDLGLDDCVMMFYLGLSRFRSRATSTSGSCTMFLPKDQGTLREKYDAAVREIQQDASDLSQSNAASTSISKTQPACAFKSNFTQDASIWPPCAKQNNIFARAIFFRSFPVKDFPRRHDTDPFEIYRALRVVNPSPYLYFLHLDDVSVVGSSPEMLVKVQGRGCLLSSNSRHPSAWH